MTGSSALRVKLYAPIDPSSPGAMRWPGLASEATTGAVVSRMIGSGMRIVRSWRSSRIANRYGPSGASVPLGSRPFQLARSLRPFCVVAASAIWRSSVSKMTTVARSALRSPTVSVAARRAGRKAFGENVALLTVGAMIGDGALLST